MGEAFRLDAPGVVPRARRCVPGRLIEAYREARREAGGGLPAQAALGPERLKGMLGWVFLAHWRAPASIVVRLSGVHIDYVLGTNVTGVDFFDLYPEAARPSFSRFYGAICGGSGGCRPCGGYTRRDVLVGGDECYDYHSIYLPLAPAGDVVPIIGAVAVNRFERRAGPHPAAARPDFRNTTRMGLFGLGEAVPDAGFDIVDIEAVLDELEGGSGPVLDMRAVEARPLLGRPGRSP